MRTNCWAAFMAFLVPGGFGDRGIEGKVVGDQICKRRKDSVFRHMLGHAGRGRRICPSVAGLKDANSSEINPSTPYPVIDLLPEQKDIEDLGGTMRLGLYPCKIVEARWQCRLIRMSSSMNATVTVMNSTMNIVKSESSRLANFRHFAGRPPGGNDRSAGPSVVPCGAIPSGIYFQAESSAAVIPRFRQARCSAVISTRSQFTHIDHYNNFSQLRKENDICVTNHITMEIYDRDR